MYEQDSVALAKLTEFANKCGVHFTIFRYSTNYRVMIGTPFDFEVESFPVGIAPQKNGEPFQVGHRWIPCGKTLSEAVDAAIQAENRWLEEGIPYSPSQALSVFGEDGLTEWLKSVASLKHLEGEAHLKFSRDAKKGAHSDARQFNQETRRNLPPNLR